MGTRIETIGRLKCRTVDALPSDTSPSLVAVFCHGYGASGSDLVPIGDELIDQSKIIRDHVRFVFPEAPLSLDHLGLPGGRAWWHIDLVKLQIAAATGRFREMQRGCPEGLTESRDQLLETIGLAAGRAGLGYSRIVLGGFSQGAMLSMDAAMTLDENLAALVAMSGSLLNESHWRDRAPKHAGLKVLQSHGTEDPLLPFEAAEWVRDLLTTAGANVDFVPFAGGHTIPYEVFDRVSGLLESLEKPGPTDGG